MRRKNLLPLFTAALMAASLLTGCGSTTSDTSEVAEEKNTYSGQTVTGEVTEIGDSSVTITTDNDDTITADISDTTTITRQMPDSPDGQTDGGTPPEMPDGEASDGQTDGGTPPEMPDGEASDGQTDGGTPPEMPDGEASDGQTDGGTPPEMPDGEASDGQTDGGTPPRSEDMTDSDSDGMSLSLDDINIGDTIEISFDENGEVTALVVKTSDTGAPAGGMGGQPGSTISGIDSYEAVTEYNTDMQVSDEDFTSTGTDENAILISGGAKVSLSNISVSRISEDSSGGDNSSFYGVGAAILDTDGTVYISDSTIDTEADGAAGVFAYGDGVIYVADTDITTTGNTAGGIHAAGGGTLYAWDLSVETQGASSAAIRSDRGGGTMVVDGGSYTSNGTGSPAVYSTADISINNASLTANGSEAVCIEGLNSLRLFDSDLSGNMSDDEQNDCTWNVILYQSMSGDSEVGNSTFEMSGGSLTAENGGMFYTTNTESTFILNDVDITYADDSEFFLRCTGNNNQRGWGTTGSNGADCNFTAISQIMEGDIIWDSISELDFYMTDGSTLTGAITDDESYAGNGGDGYCAVYIDSSSTWTVTGDSVLSKLYCAGTIIDDSGKSVTIVGSDGTVYVEGSGVYTITVDEYAADTDMSGASVSTSWNDYQVTKPEDMQ